MHPTVLHENSTLISGDFPGIARQYLQRHVVGADCPVLYHTGPAGNQSPRHVVRSNTFEEAKRLGEIVGAAVETSIRGIALASDLSIECHSARLNFPLRSFDSVSAAAKKLEESLARLTALRESGAGRATVRTAECDWFGAAETLTLAQAAADGRLARFAESCMPAEVQLIRIGEWNFVGWPGEMFVEFGLRVKARHANTFIISYANGELQGYLVTQQAVDEGGYEASNALFKSPDSGNMLVDSTLTLLK
jgi:neutral ceramidase